MCHRGLPCQLEKNGRPLQKPEHFLPFDNNESRPLKERTRMFHLSEHVMRNNRCRRLGRRTQHCI